MGNEKEEPASTEGQSGKKSRPRCKIGPDLLSDLMAPLFPNPNSLEMPNNKIVPAKYDAKAWKNMMEGLNFQPVKKKTVQAALTMLATKKNKTKGWKVSEQKLEKWTRVMSSRFKAMSAALCRGVRNDIGWALKIVGKEGAAVKANAEEAEEEIDDKDAEGSDKNVEEEDAEEEIADEDAEEENAEDEDAEEEDDEEEFIYGDLNLEDDDDDDIDLANLAASPQQPLKKRKKASCNKVLKKAEDSWVTGFHMEEKKAYRVNSADLDVMEFAQKLEEPAEDDGPNLDAAMIATWADGTKSTIEDYRVRDFRCSKDVAAKENTKRDACLFYKGDKDGKAVSVRKKNGNSISLFQQGLGQLAQLVFGDETVSLQTAIDIMTDAAKKYIDGSISREQIKQYKADRAAAEVPKAAKVVVIVLLLLMLLLFVVVVDLCC